MPRSFTLYLIISDEHKPYLLTGLIVWMICPQTIFPWTEAEPRTSGWTENWEFTFQSRCIVKSNLNAAVRKERRKVALCLKCFCRNPISLTFILNKQRKEETVCIIIIIYLFHLESSVLYSAAPVWGSVEVKQRSAGLPDVRNLWTHHPSCLSTSDSIQATFRFPPNPMSMMEWKFPGAEVWVQLEPEDPKLWTRAKRDAK